MFRNMAMSLIQHERIVTTVAKAKEARKFIEKLITLAKKNTLHARRLVLARLGPPSKAEVDPGNDSRHVIVKLFTEIAPRYADRQGGYTRVLKRHERRLGDAGETAYLELVKAHEGGKVRRPAPPAAPVLAPTPVAAPKPAPLPATPPVEATAPPQPPPAGESGQQPPTT